MRIKLFLLGGDAINVHIKKEAENDNHDAIMRALEENSLLTPNDDVFASYHGSMLDTIDMKKVVGLQVITGEEK
jgi:hypothetical protein